VKHTILDQRRQATSLAVFLVLTWASVVYSQEPLRSPGPDRPPDFSLLVWGYFDAETLADFGRRVQEYTTLRQRLETGLPSLQVTTNPDEIIKTESLLARRIRAARSSARRGEFFTRSMETQVKRLLRARVDAKTLPMIVEDNPGEFRFKLNGSYPKEKPVATMPPNLLLMLPELPEDVQYRFVGRQLVLLDVRANIVIDYIRYAIVCRECVDELDDDADDADDKHYLDASVPSRK
jgi:hypothetical protein